MSSPTVKPHIKSTAATWAEISLSALRHNFRVVQQHVAPGATVCAVVKADAYGHGVVHCALAFEAAGATWLGVTSTEEGLRVRHAGVKGRILVLRGFWHGEEEELVQHDLTPAVWSWKQIELLEAAAARLGRSGPVAVHLKVDTGMTRLGLDFQDLADFACRMQTARHTAVEGLFSHFASAEVVDAPDVDAQMQRFERAVEVATANGLAPGYLHLANSAAVVTRRASWKNFVRTGIALYGYFLPLTSTAKPGANHEEPPVLPVRPALTWKTRVLALRDVPAGRALGYSGAYVTKAPARIAALPVGYADGLNRRLSSRGRVLLRGEYAHMVGNLSMDITLVDVTRIAGVEVGDEVVLLGSDGERAVSAWEHAAHTNTVAYEILCAISKRVPRVYVED